MMNNRRAPDTGKPVTPLDSIVTPRARVKVYRIQLWDCTGDALFSSIEKVHEYIAARRTGLADYTHYYLFSHDLNRSGVTPLGTIKIHTEEKERAMVSRIENAARTAHEVNRAYCAGLGDDSQLPWDEAPQWQRDSAMAGAALVAEGEEDPAAMHRSWSDEKVKAGWVYGEAKDAEKKTHPCLVPYGQLPGSQRAKDALFVIAVTGCLGIGK